MTSTYRETGRRREKVAEDRQNDRQREAMANGVVCDGEGVARVG
jgi:hypothetical protein